MVEFGIGSYVVQELCTFLLTYNRRMDGRTHIVVIVQTHGSCEVIVQIQWSRKTHIVVIVQTQSSCIIMQTQWSCICWMNTGKGYIGKLL